MSARRLTGHSGLASCVRRRIPALLVGIALLVAPLAGPSLADGPRSPDQVRAAFLYRFMFFVRDSPLAAPDGRFCLGVLGSTPVAALLDEVDGRRVRGGRIELREFDDPLQIDSCELVFISPTIDGGAERAARALDGRGIMTVSSVEGFARNGGMVELVHDNERIRFDVNRETARSNGVHVNAELLQVARRIYP